MYRRPRPARCQECPTYPHLEAGAEARNSGAQRKIRYERGRLFYRHSACLLSQEAIRKDIAESIRVSACNERDVCGTMKTAPVDLQNALRLCRWNSPHHRRLYRTLQRQRDPEAMRCTSASWIGAVSKRSKGLMTVVALSARAYIVCGEDRGRTSYGADTGFMRGVERTTVRRIECADRDARSAAQHDSRRFRILEKVGLRSAVMLVFSMPPPMMTTSSMLADMSGARIMAMARLLRAPVATMTYFSCAERRKLT